MKGISEDFKTLKKRTLPSQILIFTKIFLLELIFKLRNKFYYFNVLYKNSVLKKYIKTAPYKNTMCSIELTPSYCYKIKQYSQKTNLKNSQFIKILFFSFLYLLTIYGNCIFDYLHIYRNFYTPSLYITCY